MTRMKEFKSIFIYMSITDFWSVLKNMCVLLVHFQEQALMALKLTKGRPDALLDILGKHQLQQLQESAQLNGHSQKVLSAVFSYLLCCYI